MPITVAACCCGPGQTCCQLSATADKLCDLGTACPTLEIINFNPVDEQGDPNPNPGLASGTDACYAYIVDRTVEVCVPQYIECNSKRFEFRWWRTREGQSWCLANPQSYGWVPYLAAPTEYGCNFNRCAVIEFCDPKLADCNLIIDAYYAEIVTPFCTCGCECIGCYFTGNQDSGNCTHPTPSDCAAPC